MDQTAVSIIPQSNQSEDSAPDYKNNRIFSMHTEPTQFSSRFKGFLEEKGTLSLLLKMGFAEFVGTAILVFLGCMGCVGSLGQSPSSLQISFTFGLAVMLIIQSIGHISDAHINPAITIGSVILGKKSIPTAIVYIIFQMLGAIIGFGLLKAVTPDDLLHYGAASSASNFCITNLHNNISVIQGFIIEVTATGILMFMTSSAWDSRNAKYGDSIAIKFGLAVSALCMAVGPYTGCSMNPARSLGPALWNNNWSYHWIFWLGPITGSIFGSTLYRSIFSP